jgi:colicin import membrane protein
MIRNILIALLAVISAILGYGYYQLGAQSEKLNLLLTQTRDKAARDQQAANDKFAAEERAKLGFKEEVGKIAAKLADEQTAREKAEQAAKTANERLTQIQNALANAEQSGRDAKEAQTKAERDKEAAQQALKESQAALKEAQGALKDARDALAKEREASPKERGGRRPTGG